MRLPSGDQVNPEGMPVSMERVEQDLFVAAVGVRGKPAGHLLGFGDCLQRM